MQDDKTKRILVTGGILLFICLVCLFVSVRHIDKYRGKVAETNLLEQRVEELEQDIKKQEIRTKELETMRYDLSLEKGQISEDYLTIKKRYVSLGKMIKTLERDVSGLQKIIELDESVVPDPIIGEVDDSEKNVQLTALRNQNRELVKKLASKTTEKMILNIALESQANRLGLSENYDPDLKEILKDLVTSLQ